MLSGLNGDYQENFEIPLQFSFGRKEKKMIDTDRKESLSGQKISCEQGLQKLRKTIPIEPHLTRPTNCSVPDGKSRLENSQKMPKIDTLDALDNAMTTILTTNKL